MTGKKWRRMGKEELNFVKGGFCRSERGTKLKMREERERERDVSINTYTVVFCFIFLLRSIFSDIKVI